MEEILKKINNFSLEIYLVAGDLLQKGIDSKEKKERSKLFEASELLQNISIALINTWQELKEKIGLDEVRK